MHGKASMEEDAAEEARLSREQARKEEETERSETEGGGFYENKEAKIARLKVILPDPWLVSEAARLHCEKMGNSLTMARRAWWDSSRRCFWCSEGNLRKEQERKRKR